MRCNRVVNAFCFALGLLFAPSGWAQASDTVSRLSEHVGFSALKADIGREPDQSDPGGACGGIVIHDWIAEKIRVITLGESVQAVSTLGADDPS